MMVCLYRPALDTFHLGLGCVGRWEPLRRLSPVRSPSREVDPVNRGRHRALRETLGSTDSRNHAQIHSTHVTVTDWRDHAQILHSSYCHMEKYGKSLRPRHCYLLSPNVKTSRLGHRLVVAMRKIITCIHQNNSFYPFILNL